MDVVHLFGIRFVIASCALKNTIPRYWSRILVALPFSSFGFIISYFFLYCSSFSLSLPLHRLHTCEMCRYASEKAAFFFGSARCILNAFFLDYWFVQVVTSTTWPLGLCVFQTCGHFSLLSPFSSLSVPYFYEKAAGVIDHIRTVASQVTLDSPTSFSTCVCVFPWSFWVGHQRHRSSKDRF